MSKARELADVIGTQDTTENVLQGRKNLIINGDFKVSQRGDYTSATAITTGNYYLDRWGCISDVVTGTVLDNSDASVTLTATSSTTGTLRLRQKIEYTVNNYGGKQYTLSAQVKSNSSNARLNVYAGGFLTITGSTAHTGNGSWETLTATFTTPDPITTEFSVHVGIDGVNSADVSITSGDYVQIKEVQLEVGSVATPFEHRSYGEELALCQRYYQKYSGTMWFGAHRGLDVNYDGHTKFGTFIYQTPMRATPSISITKYGWIANTSSWTSGDSFSVTEATSNSFAMTGRWAWTTNSNDTTAVRLDNTTLDAEL